MPANEQMLERLELHLPLDAMGFGLLVEDVNHDRVHGGVSIRAGIYIPGMGNPARSRIRIRPEVLKAIASTWKGKKIDLEHSQDLEDEVGFIQDSYYSPDVQGIRKQLRLQATRPRFLDAVGFISGRLAAGQVPELSVEFENIVLRAADAREKAFFDLDLVGAVGAGVALVTRGACGAPDGCGIGMTFAGEEPASPAERGGQPPRLALGASWRGTLEAAGDPAHVHEFVLEKWRDLMTGKEHTTLISESYEDRAANVTHNHQWLNAERTTEDAGHSHKVPTPPVSLGLARPPKANTNPLNAVATVSLTEEPIPMPCGDATCLTKHAKMETDLQTALKERDDLRTKVGAHEASLKQKDAEYAEAAKTIQGYKEAERTALLEALKAAAPQTADLKLILGAEPAQADLASIRTALACFKAAGSKPAPADGAGRRTLQTKRDAGGDPAAYLEAQRAKLGLSGADGKTPSRLPPSLQRNTPAALSTPRRGVQ